MARSHLIIQLVGLSVIPLSTTGQNKTGDSTLLNMFSFASGNDSFWKEDPLHRQKTKRANGAWQNNLLLAILGALAGGLVSRK